MSSDESRDVNAEVAGRYGRLAEQLLHESGELPFAVDGAAPNVNVAAPTLAERLYPGDDLVGLATGAASASIGCGNPLAAAAPQPGETILDLGSGGGLDCILAARAVGAAGQVIGVDATPAMIKLAEQNRAKMGLEIDRWAGAVITSLVKLDEFLGYMAAAGFSDIKVLSLTSYGLEDFDQLDEASQALLCQGTTWQPVAKGEGLYKALITARKLAIG